MPMSIECLRAAILLFASIVAFSGQGATSGETARRTIELTLELRQHNAWQPVDARTVFQPNDEIRFRFRSSISGYLYVFDRGSSGEDAWLLSPANSGESNLIKADTTYLIPGNGGSFAIGGKPGHDVTLWILSSRPIATDDISPIRSSPAPNSIQSRCREELLRAREPCLDDSAGAHALNPDDLPQISGSKSDQLIARDLTIQGQAGPTQITAHDSQGGMIVYEFHVAHD